MGHDYRRRTTRALICGLVLPLQASLLMVVGQGGNATAAPVAPPAALSAEEQAFAEAVETGEPVEIADLRETHTQTFANPDGYTMTQESVAAPRFGRNASDQLVPIDTTLVRTADGVRPTASAVDTTFPAPGEPGVTIDHDGTAFNVGLPGTFGEPTLSGSSAWYQEVLPGVDAVLTATDDGFRQVYVVKTRQAAQSAALDQLVQPVQSSEGKVLAREGGGSLLTDAAGDTVFSSGTALMWDSSGVPRGGERPEEPGAAEPVQPEDAAPMKGDEWREMPVDVVDDALEVTPDQALLDDPDTVFPVYVDPTLGLNLAGHSMLRSDGYSDWKFKDDEGVGRCPIEHGSGFRCGLEASGQPYRKRLYYQFNRGKLNGGDHILDATFAAKETWAMSCVQTRLDIVRTERIRESDTWPGPREIQHLGTVTEAAGHGPNCVGKEVTVSTEAVKKLAKSLASGTKRVTIGLRADNEDDQWGWKRFHKAAVLRVVYVRKPGKPTGVAWEDGDDVNCATYARRMSASWPTPKMRATVQTDRQPKDNRKGALRAQFQFQKQSGSDWVDQFGTASEPYRSRPAEGWAQDGQAQSIDLADLGRQLQPGSVYRMRVRTLSHWGAWNDSDEVQPGELASAWSDWCHIEYDADPPAAPIVTSVGNVYPFDDWGGGIGVTGEFKYAPNPDDNDGNVVGYDTEIVGAKFVELTNGARIIPTTWGPLQLKVRALDAAGHASRPKIYRFNVNPPTPETAVWTVTSADKVEDGTMLIKDRRPNLPTRHDLRLSSPSILDNRPGAGRRGLAVREDRSLQFGVGDFGRSVGPVLKTSDSFSFSSWVMLDSGLVDRTVLGQFTKDKTRGIELKYLKQVAGQATGSDTWSLRWHYINSAGEAKEIAANAPNDTRVTGGWTHVLGVYDKDEKKLKLYLNGRLAGESPVLVGTQIPVVTDGDFMVGRSSFAKDPNFMGRLDELRIWNSLVPPEIAVVRSSKDEISGQPFISLVANWQAHVKDLKDTSAYGRSNMALNGGAVVQNGAVQLNGTSAYVGMNGPPLDDTSSFTASVTFTLDKTKLVARSPGPDKLVRILGQQGVVKDGKSSWALWFEKTSPAGAENVEGYWRVGRWSKPTSVHGPVQNSGTETYADVDGEVTLTAVYDHAAQTVVLYVGDTEVDGPINFFDPAYGSGRLLAGWGTDQPANYMAGSLSEIRLWAGAMGPNEIDDMVDGN